MSNCYELLRHFTIYTWTRYCHRDPYVEPLCGLNIFKYTQHHIIYLLHFCVNKSIFKTPFLIELGQFSSHQIFCFFCISILNYKILIKLLFLFFYFLYYLSVSTILIHIHCKFTDCEKCFFWLLIKFNFSMQI
jgi:hypothetical protein